MYVTFRLIIYTTPPWANIVSHVDKIQHKQHDTEIRRKSRYHIAAASTKVHLRVIVYYDTGHFQPLCKHNVTVLLLGILALSEFKMIDIAMESRETAGAGYGF